MNTYTPNRAWHVSSIIILALCLATFWSNGQAQTSDSSSSAASAVGLPPGVDNLVKLTKAGLSEDIILTQVKGIGSVQLTTDQILYLNSVGVSQNVIKALLQNAPAAAATPVQEATQSSGYPGAVSNAAPVQTPANYQGSSGTPLPIVPAQPNLDYFQAQLAPYGNWLQVPGYGWAWNPGVAAADPSWRPYADEGQWAYTDAGLYWQSNYPWGDIAFHYGRWAYNGGYGGWLWIPAYDWAPAWVAWRHAEAYGYTGWAPLPPEAIYVAGIGLTFNGVLAADIDFGMPADAFVFVGYDHFWDHGYRGYFLDRYRVRDFYGRSFVRNGYRFENGRFRVEGMGRDRLGAMTHRDVRAIDARDLRGREEKSHFESRRTDPAVRNGSRPDYKVGNLRGQPTAGYGRQPVPQARPGGARPVGAKPAAAPSSKKQPDDKKKN